MTDDAREDLFIRMLFMQQQTQLVQRDGDPMTFQNDRHRIEFIRAQFEAMIHEMVEAKDECGWKYWGNAEHLNAEAMAKELVDVWCFFGNWLLTLIKPLGFDSIPQFAEWFAEAHYQKSLENQRRQHSGTYDGFTEKCPNCHREIESAVWEEEDEVLTDGNGEVVARRVRKYLVCPCKLILETKVFNEDGSEVSG